MTTQPVAPARVAHSILPKDWQVAPVVWFKKQPAAAWMFVGVNFVFGTLGIWLPLLNAALIGSTSVSDELVKLLRSGGLYLYAVPLLAAITGGVLASIVQDNAEHSRGTKTLLVGAAITTFLLCALLLEIQLFGPQTARECVNFVLQFAVSIVTVAIAVYIHALVQNETSGSAMGDMEENAEKLQSRAPTATVSSKDFES